MTLEVFIKIILALFIYDVVKGFIKMFLKTMFDIRVYHSEEFKKSLKDKQDGSTSK